MSGELFPIEDEWRLWNTHRRDRAIKRYQERPKYAFTVNDFPHQIDDNPSVDVVKERFVAWNRQNSHLLFEVKRKMMRAICRRWSIPCFQGGIYD